MEGDSDFEFVAPHDSIDPNAMDRFCDAALAVLDKEPKTKTMKASNVFRSKAFGEAGDMQDEEMHKAFIHYYKKASLASIIPAESAFKLVKKYVQTGESIELHPNYPKQPLTEYRLFLRDQGVGNFDKEGIAAAKKKLQEPHVQKKYDELYIKELHSYVHGLVKFSEEQSGLKPEQVEFLKHRIQTYQKKVESKEAAVKKDKSASAKKGEKSAFELYKLSRKESYIDLEAGARDKKLLKEFEELPKDKCEIFETLESSCSVSAVWADNASGVACW